MTKALPVWEKKLRRAERTGVFTEDDVNDADDWRSCAIGEKHDFPDNTSYIYEPDDFEDKPEYMLGMEFADAVSRQAVAEARSIYTEIRALP